MPCRAGVSAMVTVQVTVPLPAGAGTDTERPDAPACRALSDGQEMDSESTGTPDHVAVAVTAVLVVTW